MDDVGLPGNNKAIKNHEDNALRIQEPIYWGFHVSQMGQFEIQSR